MTEAECKRLISDAADRASAARRALWEGINVYGAQMHDHSAPRAAVKEARNALAQAVADYGDARGSLGWLAAEDVLKWRRGACDDASGV